MERTQEASRVVTLEWAHYCVEFWERYFIGLNQATTRPALFEAVKFSSEKAQEFLANIERNPTQLLTKRELDILFAFKAAAYPQKDNFYYWNKKGQPRLKQLQERLKMPELTKWERDSLWLMNDAI